MAEKTIIAVGDMRGEFIEEAMTLTAGGGSSHVETPRLVGLYKSGVLKIDEMVTSTYRLEDINDGYQDMLDGKNIRGVIRYGEADW
jgi:Zn-dependent alcohol dehydrogenase